MYPFFAAYAAAAAPPAKEICGPKTVPNAIEPVIPGDPSAAASTASATPTEPTARFAASPAMTMKPVKQNAGRAPSAAPNAPPANAASRSPGLAMASIIADACRTTLI